MGVTIYSDTLPGGKHWSMIVRKGTVLRLTDVYGGANAAMLFYNPVNLTERYNAPDTLKCQHTFKLTEGHCLYSDMGRVFCAITEDGFGWHDTVCGNTTKASVLRKWGETSYQTHRNDCTRMASIVFSSRRPSTACNAAILRRTSTGSARVPVDDDGTLRYDPSAAKPGARVDLAFAMDTLVLLHTCPHPLDPSPVYPHAPVRFDLIEGAAATDVFAPSATPGERPRLREQSALPRLRLLH